MITVAFCQAFLWMIVMTFYHTGMPTVAQAWYFDTFLRSLEIFCCRYHDEFAGVDMCRAVRWRWKCRQIHQVRPGGHRTARHPIWRPGGSTQRLRSWTRCWFTVATSAFLSSTFGRPKSQKHAIKAGDLGASEHFASRFFLSARSGVYELQRDERRNFTAGSCRRRPAKNALSKQQPRRKPSVGRFRTPDEMAQRYTVQASIAWICMCFFCIGVVCSAIQEILIVLICRSYPIAFRLRVQRILPKLLQKKEHRPETSN